MPDFKDLAVMGLVALVVVALLRVKAIRQGLVGTTAFPN